MLKPEAFVGKQIDQFTLEAFVARGAMGMVFKAFDAVLARTVALKLIPKPTEADADDADTTVREEARKRLIQEAKAAGKLTQPNIVTIHAYGETEEFQYICMEFISGKTLAQILKERGKIPVEEAIPIFEQILLALEAADQEGIVHRDIKPANIMITRHNQVKVMDFGIARLPSLSMTVTGMVLGTPYYMSPEQISGKKVDIRSDLFSLGAVIYEVLTGERPFEGESTATLTYKIIQIDPVPPNVINRLVPDSLATVITRALAKDPAERYQNPTEMLNDLARLAVTPAAAEETVVSHTPAASTVAASPIQTPAAHEGPALPPRQNAPVSPAPPTLRPFEPGSAIPSDRESPEGPPRPAPAKTKGDADAQGKTAGPEPGRGKVQKKPNLPLVLLVLVLLVGGVALGLRLLMSGGPSPKSMPKPPPAPPATTAPATLPKTVPTTVPTSLPTTVPAAIPTTVPTTVPAATPPPVPPSPPATQVVTPPEPPPPVTVPSTTTPPSPTVESLRTEAGRLFTRDPEAAQKLLEQALALDPNDYDSSLALARLLSYRRDYPAAIRQYQEALRLDSRAPDVHYELGSLFLGQGDYDSAIQSLQSSLILMPKNRDEVLANLGFCHLKKGEFTQARSLFQQSLELNPNNPTAKAFMASLPVPTTQPRIASAPSTTQPPPAKTTTTTTQPPPPPTPKKTRIEENLPGRWSYSITIQTGQTIVGQVDIDDSGKKLKMIATATYRLMGQDGLFHQFYEKSFFTGSLVGQNLTAECNKGELTMDGRPIPIPALPLRLSLVVDSDGRFMKGYVSNAQGVTTAVFMNKR